MKKKTDTPWVTVICHAYNHAAYIRDAMDSFLMQETDFSYMILMHDDHSTDGTTEIIHSYETQYSDRLHAICQDYNRYNESIASWYDFLYSKIDSKYIAVCDGDDYWLDPQKLQKQIAILEADDTLMACCTGCAIVDKDKKILHEQMQVVPQNRQGRYTIREFIIQGHNWPVATVVYRNSHREAVFERAIRMENTLMADWTMWIALLCEGDCYFLSDVTAAYRVNPTSMTHTDVDSRRMKQARLNFTLTTIVAGLLPEGYEDVRYYLKHCTDWMWYKLAVAYKHEHRYVAMLYSLLRFFVAKINWCTRKRMILYLLR